MAKTIDSTRNYCVSVSIGNWELNRGPNSILVSTQNENGVAGKNVKLTKKDHLVTRLLLRFPGFFSPFLVTSTWKFELTLENGTKIKLLIAPMHMEEMKLYMIIY